MVGTYLLAFFGCGAVLSAVITGARVGLWQVAVVWGFGISLAIYATAAASGAHLSPVVTLSVALRRRATFPPARVRPYWTGWGVMALPSPDGIWWADVVGPLLGGPLGAMLYDLIIRTTPRPLEERAVVYEEAPAP